MQQNNVKALYQDWASLMRFVAFSRNVSQSLANVWKELAGLKRLVLPSSLIIIIIIIIIDVVVIAVIRWFLTRRSSVSQ